MWASPAFGGWPDESFIDEEFTLKKYLRNPDGSWVDEVPDGQDLAIDAVRYAMTDDMLRG